MTGTAGIDAPPDPALLAIGRFEEAFALESRGDESGAERGYQDVLRLSPAGFAGAMARFRLGWLRMTRREPGSAVAWFDEAAREFEALPDAPAHREMRAESLYWLALCRESIGEVLAAIDGYRQLTADPRWHLDAWFRMAICHDKVGRFSEALECCRHFDQLRAAEPDRRVDYWHQADSLRQQLERLLAGLDS